MTGTGKNTAATPAKVPNSSASTLLLPRVAQHDTLHTISHILQAATHAAITSSVHGTSAAQARQQCRYVNSLARKATLRMDTSVKKSICKRCGTILLPGITSTHRVRSNGAAATMAIAKCNVCAHTSRLSSQTSSHPRLNKVLSRRRRKWAEKRMERAIEAKIEACIKFNGQQLHALAATADSNAESGRKRLGQRARRRRAREVFEARQNDSKRAEGKDTANAEASASTSHIKAKSRSRPCRRSHSSGAITLLFKDVRRRRRNTARQKMLRQAKTTRPEKQQCLHFPKFADRIRPSASSADGLANAGFAATAHLALSRRQREALDQLRGNHAISRGLGKGGAPLTLEEELQ